MAASKYTPHVTCNLPLDAKGSVPHTVAFAEARNTRMAWDALVAAAKIMAASALDLTLDPERVGAIKSEHKALRGRVPLPLPRQRMQSAWRQRHPRARG